MPTISIGVLSFSASIALGLLYVASLLIRHIIAWIKRSDPPRERALVVLLIVLVFGFGAGSLLQGAWDNSADCRASGGAPATCVVFPQGHQS